MEYSLDTTNRKRLQKNESPLDLEWLSTDDVTLMPRQGVLKSRSEAIINSFIYSSPMDTVTGFSMIDSMLKEEEFAVTCRFFSNKQKCIEESNFRGNPNLFYSAGLNKGHVDALYNSGKACNFTRNLSLDIAHGDTIYAHKLIKYAKSLNYFPKIMSGTICTPQGAERALLAGCTHIRVGVGSGSACTTRVMTGCGLPNLTAVYRIYKYLSSKYDKNFFTLIADGGIRYPGDAVKYIAAGAKGVMLGNVLSRAIEAPGWIKNKETGELYKEYRGQASFAFQKERLDINNPRHVEGITCGVINPEYTVEEIISHYKNSLRSAISYLGINNINDLIPENVTFVKVTSNGLKEGSPHGKITK